MKIEKKDTLDLLEMLERKADKCREVFGLDGVFLDEEISLLWKVIEAQFEINPLCSDGVSDILLEFADGSVSKSATIKKLKMLSAYSHKK